MSYDYQASPESYFATRLDEENDLDRCMNESPHVVTFWNAVCAYINHEREHGEDPDELGYITVVTNGSRAEADQYADSNRIACINITFKEGEGL